MLWVKQVIIPIFGTSFTNSDGREINTKDLCEFDHLLPDFSNKFIPTLNDYMEAVSDDNSDKDFIETFQRENKQFFEDNPEIKELMLSPLYNTGKLKSLLITHNSWFIGFILPKIFKEVKIEIKDYNISPSRLFARMNFESWMNNGKGGIPPSFKKIYEKKNKAVKEIPKDIVYDGSIFPKFIPNPIITPGDFDDTGNPIIFPKDIRDKLID